jgi:hypothetical protein
MPEMRHIDGLGGFMRAFIMANPLLTLILGCITIVIIDNAICAWIKSKKYRTLSKERR